MNRIKLNGKNKPEIKRIPFGIQGTGLDFELLKIQNAEFFTFFLDFGCNFLREK